MFNAILVPLEGTYLAQRAVDYAISVARACLARIDLYHWAPPLAIEQHPADERGAALQLDSLGGQIRSDGIAVETMIDREFHADEAAAIVDAARAHSSDLIVMASRGRAGIEDAVLGSTAERVARSADSPVLVIPTEYDQPWSRDPDFHLLVPLDGSSDAEVALAPARALSEVLKGRLTLLTFIESTDGGNRGRAEAYLGRLGASLLSGVASVEAQVEVGRAHEALPRFAREHDVDLVVMGSHGRSGVKRLALGSVTEATLRDARVPVLVVRQHPRWG